MQKHNSPFSGKSNQGWILIFAVVVDVELIWHLAFFDISIEHQVANPILNLMFKVMLPKIKVFTLAMYSGSLIVP